MSKSGPAAEVKIEI